MIKLIKKYFSKKVDIKPRELSEEEQYLLRLLESYGDNSSDIGNIYYLKNHKTIEFLGRWAYPDVDIVKHGRVGRLVETGEIIDISSEFLFERNPHDWFHLLSIIDQHSYLLKQRQTDDSGLFLQFYHLIPKENLREMKLKSLLED